MNPKDIGLIDNRNEKLWNDLNKTHSVDIIMLDYPSYAIDSVDDKATIVIPENDIDIDSFTHELLHLLIRRKEQYFGSSLEMFVRGNEILTQIFTDELIEHFANCIDHIKMLPIYLELGFEKKKFISDYDVNKCTKSEIQQIKNNYKIRGKHNGEAIEFYIAKYISIKSDPKQHINYPKSLAELKTIDSKLFGILEKCIAEWKEMSLESKNFGDANYRTISFDLYQSLSDWTENKTFK